MGDIYYVSQEGHTGRILTLHHWTRSPVRLQEIGLFPIEVYFIICKYWTRDHELQICVLLHSIAWSYWSMKHDNTLSYHSVLRNTQHCEKNPDISPKLPMAKFPMSPFTQLVSKLPMSIDVFYITFHKVHK